MALGEVFALGMVLALCGFTVVGFPIAFTLGGTALLFAGVGAGLGDWVIITSDGREARRIVGHDNTPVRWTVIGMRDA